MGISVSMSLVIPISPMQKTNSKKKSRAAEVPVISVRFDTPELVSVYAAIVTEGSKNERNPTAQLRQIAKDFANASRQ